MASPEAVTILSALRKIFSRLTGVDDVENTPNDWVDPAAQYPTLLYDTYLKHLELGSQAISCARLVQALLIYSYDTQVVGKSLWTTLTGSAGWCNAKIETKIDVVTSGDWVSMRLRLRDNYTWGDIADKIAKDKDLAEDIYEWSNNYWRNLFIPFYAKGATPVPASAPSASRSQLNLREQLFRRDGYISAVGDVVEDGAPRNFSPDGRGRGGYAALLACHIIPFATQSNPGLIKMLKHFSAGHLLEETLTTKINDPSNALLLDMTCHERFDKLAWSIEATSDAANYPSYKIRFLTSKLPMSITSIHLNGGPLQFCKGSEPQIAPPSVLFCQIHCSLAKVMRASGAAEILYLHLRDEDDLKAPGIDGSNWGEVGAVYLNRLLETAVTG